MAAGESYSVSMKAQWKRQHDCAESDMCTGESVEIWLARHVVGLFAIRQTIHERSKQWY